MSWYRRLNRKADAQLGMSLGKWLVLFANGQYDPAAATQDITSYVAMNPTGVDPEQAKSVATNYFTSQMMRPPTDDETSMLEQWTNMVGNPVPPDQQQQEPQQAQEQGTLI
jgi:hypothetical protein